MYNSYFAFLESPFENRLDQRFLFLGEDHQEVLAALLYFIRTEKGFAVVCGDVGTGKTMLINCFLERLPKSVRPIIISNPNVPYEEIIRYMARTLGIEPKQKSVLELTDEVKQALVEARSQGTTFVLIVDEAHLLADSSLEDIRLLSNIETRDHKLLQILLVGQYELSHKLDRQEMRQLRQRINISRFLSPLGPAETISYIDHRLKKVGSDFASCFEKNCQSLIFRMTEGVPRTINLLCDSALLVCMSEGKPRVNRRILKKAQETLLTDRIFTPKSVRRRPAGLSLYRFGLGASVGIGIVLLVLLATRAGPLLFPVIGTQSQGRANFSPELKRSPAAEGIKESASVLPNPSKSQSQDKPAPAATGEISAPSNDSPLLVNEPPLIGPGAQKHLPAQIMVHKGECLSLLAARWYPENAELGIEAIILANLKNSNENLLQPGQVLFLPKVDAAIGMVQLRDRFFYAPYGRYRSFEKLQELMPWLSQKKIRYLILNSIESSGTTAHLILGGYETEKDLKKAMEILKNKFGWPASTKPGRKSR